ncbi:MAG TPA: polymer-forming cytoskeletal protein [Blastocatellia bacterium]|nr:polymer-forming cytoskeletal protein [Blastocatellia bacterium]
MKLVKSNGPSTDFGIISRGIEVSGEVVFADQLRVDGRIIGKVASDKGTLIIEDSGQVEAQVDVATCIIRGSLYGNLTAKNRSEIHRTGRVQGDVTTPVLLVEEGAVFNGAVKMTQESGRLLEVGEDAESKRKIKGI